jgi:hypothetical protein
MLRVPQAVSRRTVFVNPDNAWQAVLDPGGDPKFAAVMLSVSLIFSLLGLTQIWKRKQP